MILPGKTTGEAALRVLAIGADDVCAHAPGAAAPDARYEAIRARTRDQAMERFRGAAPQIVLCDLDLPGASGLDLLRDLRMRAPGLRLIAVASRAEDALAACRAGADEALQRPLDPDRVRAAFARAANAVEAERKRRSVQRCLLRERREFVMPNDIDLVPHLTGELTRWMHDDPALTPAEIEGMRTSLHEMLLNAIEHGNLGITYEEKGRLVENLGDWVKEIERRGADPRYRRRRVRIVAENDAEAIRFRIADEGEGFDRDALPDPAGMADRLHGRGILIAGVRFDDVRYNAAGNEVTLVKYKNGVQKAP